MRQPGAAPHGSFVARSGYYQGSSRVLDNGVPAVLLRIDPNSFHHGTSAAVRSVGRTAASQGSPVRRSSAVVARSW
ncbi:hypothetical protein ACFVEN_30190 [Streptomyces sp. NPDC057681]|uniref:hypothetical protein n=1 Tax=Streptomyces sp. NPDC057681 TaxID=3346209 RepID=UPI0036751D40